MSVVPIRTVEDPVLRVLAEPVTAFDEELRSLVADMVATMYAADGVGLAACQIGVVAANGTQQQLDAAKTYAQNLGLAFQIRDDMLDVLGDAAKLGKATHVDENKNTFVRLYGIGACSKMIEAETKSAIAALSCFQNSDFLVEMAGQLALREY